MAKRVFQILLSVAVGGLFLWLAFRNVRYEELMQNAEHLHYGWLLPFVLVTLFSHYCRAERWRLLIEEEGVEPRRLTLFSGVMVGYLLNLVFPRLGEISRPVYVARREDLSSSTLFGTIVVERVIDMTVLAVIMLLVGVYLIADVKVLQQLFGKGTVDVLAWAGNWTNWGWLLLGAIVLAGGGYGTKKILSYAAQHVQMLESIVQRLRNVYKMFMDGLLSVRKVESWPLFVIYSLAIWFCYVLMTYIPFWMFNLQDAYGLGLLDALTLTAISSVGIILPSPGGIGTYHWFVKQSLFLLFAVPMATGLAYATITHAVMMLIIILSTPLIIMVDRLVHGNRSRR